MAADLAAWADWYLANWWSVAWRVLLAAAIGDVVFGLVILGLWRLRNREKNMSDLT